MGAAVAGAAGAVATIIRLEVRAGAPGAAVPVVAGGSEAGLGAGVAGGRREPRPQQQDMYNGAGSEVCHGGEYVQLTWLLSGSQVAMWCKAMGRSRLLSKIVELGALSACRTNKWSRTQHIFTE